MKQRPFSLDAVQLRLLALGCMLLDHMWATVVPGNDWMTVVGRLAFPIFAFQAAEGYAYTSNFKQYCWRLLGFGLLSEIPFDWMVAGDWLFPYHQNVLFTLLLGLLALRAVDRAEQGSRWWLLGAVGCCLVGALAMVDYGMIGVLTVLLFGLSRKAPHPKAFQLAGMIVLHILCMEGRTVPLGFWEFPVQGTAVLALLPIWLYSGEKGRRSKALQLGCYLFYPVHMAVLAML